jgi:hypothetical protein
MQKINLLDTCQGICDQSPSDMQVRKVLEKCSKVSN